MADTIETLTSTKIPRKRENLFYAVIFNIALPIFILSKTNGLFGPTKSLLIAIFFPIGYAIFDFYRRKQINPLSVIGVVSLLLKGTFALFKLDGVLFALQEAAMPTFVGLFAIASIKFRKPLVNYFIYNETVFNIEKLEQKLVENQNSISFYRLLKQLTWLFGITFLLGGVLNYFLALNIIVSPAGTSAFNQELAHMIFLSYIVVVVPKLIITAFGLWWLIHNIKKLTGLPLNDIWQASPQL